MDGMAQQLKEFSRLALPLCRRCTVSCNASLLGGKQYVEYINSDAASPPDAILNEDLDIIEKKRNKSGLQPHHYRILHKQAPELTDDEIALKPLARYRKLYGQYGSASGVSIAKLWPSNMEYEYIKEYEKVAYPTSVRDMIELAKKEAAEEEEKILKRQMQIKENLKNLEMWKKQIRDRVARKEAAALEAKRKKEEQVEAVRQMFGFRVDPKDERFQQALLKREEEERKAAKKLKKLKRQEQILQKLQADLGSVGQGLPIAGQVSESGSSNEK